MSRHRVVVRNCDSSHAGVAELADALDLGSSVPDVQVQVLSPALLTYFMVCEFSFSIFYPKYIELLNLILIFACDLLGEGDFPVLITIFTTTKVIFGGY